ncbi:hypothetical protein GLYMA_20G146350v4 [Glycine max]|nr:hypothetical protein GLYMA_20G146350v4 [Glycine max]KAH1036127.1 hypothetical protein GYH30_055879 [Glycine max]
MALELKCGRRRAPSLISTELSKISKSRAVGFSQG